MKTLKEQLYDRLNSYINSSPLEKTIKYHMPHKFSFITLEEFCELNSILEDDLTDYHITYFYEHYGKSTGLPASKYDATHDHNDWIIENLQSHNCDIVIRRLQKLLDDNIISVDTSRLSEKLTNARIIKVELNKECDIFNEDSDKTFVLNNSDLAVKINDILRFHNYYITLIYFYQKSNVIILELKQTDNATDFVKQSKYVYHVTHKDNIKNILKKGLRPKTKKMNDENPYRFYTDRTFLVADSKYIIYDIQNVIRDLALERDYAILKIDISRLNITYWWDDASKGNTVYTVESIPPKFITVINDITEL